MDLRKIRIIALLALITIVSCSKGPVKENQFTGFSEITKGEEAKLYWSFENVEKVRIEGFDKDFASVDSAFVSPLKSTKYNIRAYQSNGESVEYDWRVYVKDPAQSNEPIRGPGILTSVDLTPSDKASKYLKGLIKYSGTTEPYALRITGVEYSTISGKTINYHALVLDQYGNYINSIPAKEQSWQLVNSCGENRLSSPALVITEKELSLSEPALNISLSIDNSLAAINNLTIMSYIRDFVSNLNSGDLFSFSHFNQNYQREFEASHAEYAYTQINSYTLPQESGLNAIFKAAYVSLINQNSLEDSKKKVNIIITYNSDNSSITYDVKDVAVLAKDSKIPVYVIGIGDAIETYALRYLAQSSGGRFYHVREADIMDLRDILREIFISCKAHYTISADINEEMIKCKETSAELSLTAGRKHLTDKYKIVLSPGEEYSNYQSVAAFNYKDSTIDEGYEENLVALAQVLIDNPASAVQLIGHSSLEGDTKFNNSISLKRAQNVRKKLLDFGASPNQIRVRAEGSNMPVYYMQSINWQQYFNRRVEVKWLDPSLMPFELIAESVDSETQALEKVENWESKGLNAYFQRYLKENQSIYRIKLWGYKSLKEAEEAAKTLQKSYKISMVIE
jgi:outer membrane protein OmpA-like peptidoglycan-associated protein